MSVRLSDDTLMALQQRIQALNESLSEEDIYAVSFGRVEATIEENGKAVATVISWKGKAPEGEEDPDEPDAEDYRHTEVVIYDAER